MTKDKIKDFWRNFIEAWERLDSEGITDVVASHNEKGFGWRNPVQTVFSKHTVDSEAIRYLGEFRQTFAERLAVIPYNELEAYQREYNAFNSDFVETRKANVSSTLLIDSELLPNDRTKIKCIIRNGEIKNIDFSFNDFYGRMNQQKKIMFPLDKLRVLDNSNGYYQIGTAQLLDAKKGEHINTIYFVTWTYPLLPYVIGKAYYCKYLFDKIERLERNDDNTPTIDTNTQKLTKELLQYQFNELEKVKVLSPENQKKLLQNIATNKAPYQIAMLNYLGFIEHLLAEHCDQTKYRMYKILVKITGVNERTIKGNINALVPNSNDRNRYTSYLHTKDVEKYYNSLK